MKKKYIVPTSTSIEFSPESIIAMSFGGETHEVWTNKKDKTNGSIWGSEEEESQGGIW